MQGMWRPARLLEGERGARPLLHLVPVNRTLLTFKGVHVGAQEFVFLLILEASGCTSASLPASEGLVPAEGERRGLPAIDR